MTYRTDLPPLIVAIQPEAHRVAMELAAAQSTPKKRQRVYLNTLAVSEVHSYLEWMEFETDLSGGDSWNPYLCGLLDAADLILPRIGRLECRPVLPGENAFRLPIDVPEDLIGYIAVQFEENLDQVKLLGFIPFDENLPEQIPIASVQPLDALIDYLDELEVRELEETVSPNKLLVLRQWFQNLQSIIEAGYQTLESYLNNSQDNLDWRFASVSRSNRIEAETPSARVCAIKELELAGQSLALVVYLTTEVNQNLGILLRVYPSRERTYLPSNLQMIVIDESGNTFRTAQARSDDNFIQLEFNGQFGERFSIQLSLDNASFTEYFAI
ncbi:MAG TPA: hypothetical protein DCE56_09480 [Cyanobacteria bacterium UBA8553]|nr:hypothetical protein [Cyanobacteria bacterium UBA8553]